MSYYKIQTLQGTFRASVEETNDMYRVKYGGQKACFYFSMRSLHHFKKVKESDVYDMLKTCWDESTTYKEFFVSV